MGVSHYHGQYRLLGKLRLGIDRALFFTNLRICVGRNMCDVRKEQICYSNAQIDFCYSNAQPMELRICAFKIDLRIWVAPIRIQNYSLFSRHIRNGSLRQTNTTANHSFSCNTSYVFQITLLFKSKRSTPSRLTPPMYFKEPSYLNRCDPLLLVIKTSNVIQRTVLFKSRRESVLKLLRSISLPAAITGIITGITNLHARESCAAATPKIMVLTKAEASKITQFPPVILL